MSTKISYKTQKSDWGTSLQLEPTLWRLRLRHPPGPGRSRIIINTYVYFEDDTLAVIDPGWPGTVDGLDQALRSIGARNGIESVDAWLYTHAHIDHMGAAALLGARSNAPHIASRGLLAQIGRWHAFQDELHDWRPWIARAFAEPHRSKLLAARKHHHLRDIYGPSIIQNAQFIEFGERIQVGGLHLDFLDARGHDPHHGVFFSAERGWLFCGDVALSVPTPLCQAMGDCLPSYRQSLGRVARLPATLLLPGHGLHRRDDIPAIFQRARGFIDHYHSTTLSALHQLNAPADLYQIGLLTTPEHHPLQPDERWWVHLALVDSHLQEMRSHGHVDLVDTTNGPYYRLSDFQNI